MQAANPTHGELVEEEEEADMAEEHPGDEPMQATLDKMTEEINEIIPEGEEILRETETQVETAEEEQEETEP